uniref:SET domain-containing protein n=1 Tax=Nyssomyia neivai TaxID=330878 RepID=A0A1L8DC02_9DIPT
MAIEIFSKFSQEVYCSCCPTKERVFGDLKKMRLKKQPHSDYIDYFLKMLSESNLIPDIEDLEEAKSDKKSEEYRKLGNKYFLSHDPHDYVEALKEYNKSACFALSTEHKSTAISNRSAVLFKMEMFPECIESIRLAREFSLPERLKDKLEHREQMCREKLRNEPPEDVLVPMIDLPVNEKIPYIAKCLALRENKKFGRHIIAEEEIPAGTIIALDKPYCQVIVNSHKYIRCTTCLLQVPHLLIPCDTCTQAMFCSMACKEKALKEFHAIECAVSGSLLKLFRPEYLLASRMVVCAYQAFPDTQTMQGALKKMEKEKKTIFNFDCSQELSPEEKYTPIHTLVTNENNHDENYLLPNYVMSCLIFNVFKKGSTIFRQRYLTTREDENFLKNIIFRHCMISFHNANLLSCMTVNSSGPGPGPEDEYGNRISSFTSLINHSCCSNTRCFPIGTSYGMVTIKKIAAGEQIFNTFGIFYTSMELKMRQDEALQVYGFQCKCLACTRNFSMYNDLPEPANLPPFKADLFRNMSPSSQKDKFQKVVEYIRKYGHHYPTKQLVEAESEFVYSFRSMYKDYSLYWRVHMSTKGSLSFVVSQYNKWTPFVVGKP